MKKIFCNIGITLFVLTFLATPANVFAKPITDSKPLGGMSYALESYYNAVLVKGEAELEKALDAYVTNINRYSTREMNILYRIVEAEAGNNSNYCKRNVAHVILNRVDSSRFPNSIEDVVFQKTGSTYQFSPIRSGGRYWTQTVKDSTKKAVDEAIREHDQYNANNALFFKMITTKSSYFSSNLDYLFEDEEHNYWTNM